MKRLVVDASVIAAAFFREKHTEAARTVLLSDGNLCAPDLIYAEVANVVWKRHRHGEINAAEVADLLNDVLDLPLEITSSEQLVGPALALALRTGRTVYDCLYVALAIQERTVMVSDDQRLVNALADGPLKAHVRWIGVEQ
jgi:predicted nucleic acid-binding protein